MEAKKVRKQAKDGAPLGGKGARAEGCRRSKAGKRYTFEERLRAVKLFLEEGIPAKVIVEELGVSDGPFYTWVKRYREEGEAGLRNKPKSFPGRHVAQPVKAKIISLKKSKPAFGVKRISQFLRRFLFLSASHETVRKTLTEANLIEKSRHKPRRNPGKPRFFERATPNQLWQSDIFTFRLLGKAGYVIAFMDLCEVPAYVESGRAGRQEWARCGSVLHITRAHQRASSQARMEASDLHAVTSVSPMPSGPAFDSAARFDSRSTTAYRFVVSTLA